MSAEVDLTKQPGKRHYLRFEIEPVEPISKPLPTVAKAVWRDVAASSTTLLIEPLQALVNALGLY